MESSTVVVHSEQDDRILRMTWARAVSHDDITTAFKTLKAYLDHAPEPVFVIVDLTSKPMFPMLHTSFQALPAFVHKNLKCWLVVGESSLGRVIEQTLVRVSRRTDCVLWFHNMRDASAYVSEQLAVINQ